MKLKYTKKLKLKMIKVLEIMRGQKYCVLFNSFYQACRLYTQSMFMYDQRYLILHY